MLKQLSCSNINISDKQDPKKSLISKAFKKNRIKSKTKTTLLNKSEVYIQTLKKWQQLGFSK